MGPMTGYFEVEPEVIHGISHTGAGEHTLCGDAYVDGGDTYGVWDRMGTDGHDDTGTPVWVFHKRNKMVTCKKCIEAIDLARQYRCKRGL